MGPVGKKVGLPATIKNLAVLLSMKHNEYQQYELIIRTGLKT